MGRLKANFVVEARGWLGDMSEASNFHSSALWVEVNIFGMYVNEKSLDLLCSRVSGWYGEQLDGMVFG
jgi:hypothetical protein